MKMLLAVLAISVFTAFAEGSLEPGLRVRYGTFYNVSLTVSEAKAAGWCITRRPCNPTPHLPQLSMYCTPGKCLCALYDDNGHVAGLQVALPKAKFKNNTFDWEKRGFQLWRTRVDKQCIEMYAMQQYFISAEFLNKSKEVRLALRDPSRLLQEDAIWITKFNRELMKLSNDEDIVGQGFTKQACFPSMALIFTDSTLTIARQLHPSTAAVDNVPSVYLSRQHFMYNITPKTACVDENFLPWFVMTMNGKLVTSAFNNFGSLPLGTPDFFERPDRDYVKGKILPYGPKCLYDLVQSAGLVTMHIYYTSTPLLVTC